MEMGMVNLLKTGWSCIKISGEFNTDQTIDLGISKSRGHRLGNSLSVIMKIGLNPINRAVAQPV
jgi:hypothetical protein